MHTYFSRIFICISTEASSALRYQVSHTINQNGTTIPDHEILDQKNKSGMNQKFQ
jgi:hypothetical protein